MPRKNTVLIIDDEEPTRREIRRCLEEARLFDDYFEAGDGIDGFKFLGMKKARPEFDSIPVLMLTGRDEVRLKIKALEQGASDYITKPFHDGELVARIRVHYKIKQLQEELRETNRRLEQLSITDDLTKLFNRRYFMELFELEFQRAQRYEARLSFVMIDIDQFKLFNDLSGHLVGDRVLYEVAQIMRENLRVHDIVGRYGGEEFALLMPETDTTGALVVAERYRRRVEEFIHPEGDRDLRVTICLGVASYPHPGIKSVDDLIRQADAALYKAKNSGRNRVETAE